MLLKFLIPLRNNLGADLRKYGRIGHSIPSTKRKNAGLDYRYTLVINDEKYLELQNEKKIPESQYRKLEYDYYAIEKEFETYLNGYIKAAKKKRHEKEPLFPASGFTYGMYSSYAREKAITQQWTNSSNCYL